MAKIALCPLLLVMQMTGVRPEVTGCDESKCRNGDPRTGYVCWNTTPGPSPVYSCADGYEGRALPNVTSPVDDTGVSQHHYTCCPPGYSGPLSQDCSITTCSNPGPLGLCWTLETIGQPMTCSGDVFKFPRRTGATITIASQFICCKHSDGSPALSSDQVVHHGVQLALGCLGFCSGMILILSILLSPKHRCQAFNLYLVFLALPDAIFNGFTIAAISCSFSGIAVSYQLWQGVMQFYYASNIWLNADIGYQIYKLLRNSKSRKKTDPPSLRMVYRQVAAVYLLGAIYGTWMSFLYSGKVKRPFNNNGEVGFKVVYWVGSFLVILLPLLYLVIVCVRIWRDKLLPLSGRTRVLAFYFLRVVLVFALIWIPVFILGTLLALNGALYSGALKMWYAHIYLTTLQGSLSVAMSLTKPDVRGAVKCFLMCTCGNENVGIWRRFTVKAKRDAANIGQTALASSSKSTREWEKEDVWADDPVQPIASTNERSANENAAEEEENRWDDNA